MRQAIVSFNIICLFHMMDLRNENLYTNYFEKESLYKVLEKMLDYVNMDKKK